MLPISLPPASSGVYEHDTTSIVTMAVKYPNAKYIYLFIVSPMIVLGMVLMTNECHLYDFDILLKTI